MDVKPKTERGETELGLVPFMPLRQEMDQFYPLTCKADSVTAMVKHYLVDKEPK